jgi:serine/threonine protein phosphatase PrpC
MAEMLSVGISEQGNVRGNNEDRYHIDQERGIYLVVDGMGGQAAGEEAAEIAVRTIRARLERATDSPDLRIREAIALANNAIFDAALQNPAWTGMACVLTVAVLENGTATLGHVGDSRAYKFSAGHMEKITRDHSPVGEREDSGELSEEVAMRHPRRNEVYRDVGSTPRTPDDPDFIEIYRVKLGSSDALLLCSDGLSDVVPSRQLARVVEECAGDPATALNRLVAEAVSTGKDNVSAVLIEGADFTAPQRPAAASQVSAAPVTPRKTSLVAVWVPLWIALALLVGFGAGFTFHLFGTPEAHTARVLRVGKGAFVTVIEAVMRAEPGDIVDVEPGHYPEHVILKEGTRLHGSTGAFLDGGIAADDLRYASVQGVTVNGITVHNAKVDFENIAAPGSVVEFNGNSTGSLRHSRVGRIVLKDEAKPVLEGNSVESRR